MLQMPEDSLRFRGSPMGDSHGPKGPLARFLADFGPALLEKYKPKGILVFSAHWETDGERLGECTLCASQVPFRSNLTSFAFILAL